MPDIRFVQVACWWKGTELHKQTPFAIPLSPISTGSCSVHRRPSIPSIFHRRGSTQYHEGPWAVSISLLTPLTDSKPRKDNILRFTFHGEQSENDQEPGWQLDQKKLSVPLKELAGQTLWMKVQEARRPLRIYAIDQRG
ncbi:uncharacterized protein BT62DRAFT_362985 [Guyanagaster necrorhizus]|uniref:Uncharacterized protein n=1 Tax=Guyanagaster necrorhizus TaxID=856835 RepID=A0A9P7VLU6_9AGAR|nr:uncharacterized protein BT62DRAFT_362985 [Guyanagaster necrorhizus MCA 3950]KAG7442900.1 hypothetical protein BT62DRAFT_362985 [Guyanagaster necrorhizus MCA 3950]